MEGKVLVRFYSKKDVKHICTGSAEPEVSDV